MFPVESSLGTNQKLVTVVSYQNTDNKGGNILFFWYDFLVSFPSLSLPVNELIFFLLRNKTET